jgi:hypothetical protein
MLVMWALSTMEDTRGVITANTEKQLQTKTSPEIAKWHRLAINATGSLHRDALYSSTPSTRRRGASTWCRGRSTTPRPSPGCTTKGSGSCSSSTRPRRSPTRCGKSPRARSPTRCTEIIWLVFGNGTRATGRFRECFRKFRHRWSGKHIDSRTVEGTNKAQLAKVVEDNGEDSDYVKIRVRGLFPPQSPKQFISETDVDARSGAISARRAVQLRAEDPHVRSGVDRRRSARDRAPAGAHFKILLKLPKNDNDVWVANKLARLEDEHQADASSSTAATAPASRAPADDGPRLDARLVRRDADDPGYVNKRAEM